MRGQEWGHRLRVWELGTSCFGNSWGHGPIAVGTAGDGANSCGGTSGPFFKINWTVGAGTKVEGRLRMG